ncbi:MAG: biopolymer transporter ExbD [Verrucomicrobiota bacterium]
MIVRRRHVEDVGFQIAPMIDITWILIIFFMVTTQLVENDFDVPVDLPIATAAVVPKEMAGRVIVNVDAAGKYYLGNTPVDLAGLTSHLKQRMIEYPPLKVYLRADANTPAQKTKEFYRACAESGAVEVVLGTFNETKN